MSTILTSMQHARAFLKVSPTYAETEEVRIANTVNGIIVMYHRWHWLTAAGTNVSLSNGVQDYDFAAGDQNTVMAIQEGYLTDASFTYPPLLVESNYTLNTTSDTGRPHCVGMLSPTRLRFFVTPNGTYTFHFRKYKRPTVFTANTESFDCPTALDAVVKAGLVWQLLDFKDDTRADSWQKTFYGLLDEHKRMERTLTGRVR